MVELSMEEKLCVKPYESVPIFRGVIRALWSRDLPESFIYSNLAMSWDPN